MLCWEMITTNAKEEKCTNYWEEPPALFEIMVIKLWRAAFMFIRNKKFHCSAPVWIGWRCFFSLKALHRMCVKENSFEVAPAACVCLWTDANASPTPAPAFKTRTMDAVKLHSGIHKLIIKGRAAHCMPREKSGTKNCYSLKNDRQENGWGFFDKRLASN
jgi:hypothetical protein